MRNFIYILLFILSARLAAAQPPLTGQQDTSRLIGWIEAVVQPMPLLTVSENSRSEDAGSFMPSLLHARRDLLLSTAAFHFNIVRFRLRGYDSEWSGTSVNGIAVNNPEDGNTPWALWSGLNDVTRQVQTTVFSQAAASEAGGMGTHTTIDMRAHRQRAGQQVSCGWSNRSYAYRMSYTIANAFNSSGWAWAASGSCRYALHGYQPGTFLTAFGYYVAADKKLGEGKLLSATFFGNAAHNGKQSAITGELAALLGTSRYNSYWGEQAGQQRNAYTAFTHVPVMMVNYENRLSNHAFSEWSASFMFGRKSSTAPDWYHAPDPRPDYYRNLPSYRADTMMRETIREMYQRQPGLLQWDWEKMYNVNRNSMETIVGADGIPGKTFTGLRSHYIIEERVSDIRRFDIAWQYHFTPGTNLAFSGGFAGQWQRVNYYKRVYDLLGGEYYMNWNQFAEGDPAVMQYDMDHPDRIIRAGDKYGYDYSLTHCAARVWGQASFKAAKWDIFFSTRLGYTSFFREGHVRTGLFPDASAGRSVVYEFEDYLVKAGVTCKINGRRYLVFAIAAMSRPPLADNVFISPRTRHTDQETIDMQLAQGSELSYHIRSPNLTVSATLYATRFLNGMNVLSFYHDGYRGFVNYALRHINRLHYGSELGVEYQLDPQWNCYIVLSAGKFVYTERPELTVTSDNDAYVLERGIVYAKNAAVGGTPQQAYSAGASFRSDAGLFASISFQYFREHWLDINPLRRTYQALSQLQPGTTAWHQAIAQERLPEQYTLDVSGGRTIRLRRKHGGPRSLLVFLSINNLLNNKNLVSGGYEQLRFDALHPERFRPKYFYTMGWNASLTFSIRF